VTPLDVYVDARVKAERARIVDALEKIATYNQRERSQDYCAGGRAAWTANDWIVEGYKGGVASAIESALRIVRGAE
jgi:hypothetical protein